MSNQTAFGGPSNNDATNDPSPLDAIREQTNKIEEYLDTLSDPIKPYVHTPISTLQLSPPRCLAVVSRVRRKLC